MKPEMNVIKLQHSCQLMAGSPVGLMTPVSFDDGYDTDTTIDF